ncbi:glycosyltransferase [Bosea thiooxidans]|jgi:glycosyltransferase involved in cell wall biosynthesis|nr:glycosyltransferase [Bosea thiooxidans]
MRSLEPAKVTSIGAFATGRQVLMLVVSDLRIDPRVEREALALAAAGYTVTVICPDPTLGRDKGIAIDWGKNIDVRFIDGAASQYVMARPGFEGGLLFEAALAVARELQPLAIHAHDLNTSLVGLAVARQTGAHFIADFHEWTSENVHWDDATRAWAPYPPDWKAEIQALEIQVMREASAVVTVCDSIADAIAEELGGGRRPVVIRNIPETAAQPTKNYPQLKTQLGLPEDQFLLLWQGGTGTTRLIEPIIEALEFAPRCILAIRGPSLDEFGPGYRAIAEKIGARDRLLLCDPVPSRDVVAAARGADAGIWTLPRLCRNFTYALPNKIFEYTAANLAVLVADYPEARRMIQDHQIGLAFDPYDPRSIAAVINRLVDDPQLASRFRRNTSVALAALDADGEWQKLVALYDALPRTGTPSQDAKAGAGKRKAARSKA